MPVGRFRDDPRELGEREREVFARQHAEGALVVGSLLGTVVPVSLRYLPLEAPGALTSPVAAILGVLGGGVGGYLLGHAYRERLRRNLATTGADGRAPLDTDDGQVAPDGDGSAAKGDSRRGE